MDVTDAITLEKARRWKMLQKLEADRSLLAGVKEYYRTHPGAFTNDWITTYNPEVQPSKIPFNLFKRQWELFQFFQDCYINREDGLVDKTRNMGATWGALTFGIEKFLFEPDSAIGFGSRKEELIDKKGDLSSIFEKIRMVLELLPPIFKPKGYNSREHARYRLISNPENGSFIFGEAGDNIGRGARASMFFIDEAAHIERSEQVDAALSETSQCKIYISTPHGMDNTFYVKRHSGEMKVFSMPWTDDPRKTKEWYDKKKRTTDPVVFAQEYDLDYAASLTNVVIPANWVRAAVNFDPGVLPSGKKIGGLDVADGGGDLNALAVRQGWKAFFIEAWGEGNTTETANKALALCERNGVEILNYDCIGVGAGVRGAASTFEQRIKFEAINVGSNDMQGYIESGDNFNSPENKLKKDFYLNIRAMLWWELRRRFEKTYEYVNGINTSYAIDDLISIPNDNGLITELSTPTYKYSNAGKIQIQSKADMKIKSPNKADALMLSFAPIDPGPGLYII
jgi:hypothetical protein